MSLIGQDLSFGYSKKHRLFQNINIQLDPGQTLGLQGYSGSGKTTLGKILAGYLPTQTGYVEVEGECQSVRSHGFSSIQMIHQHPEKSINPRWKMGRVLMEADMDQAMVMDVFGIRKDWLNRWPIELSGGELQRFCMARAFDKRTRYIIADEMTTMLDAITQVEVWKQCKRLCQERNIGLIVISHHKAMINKLCDMHINM